MASEPTLYFLLFFTAANIQLAQAIFFAGFLIVRGAYHFHIVDANSIREDKLRKGTLAISTVVLILGIFATFALATGTSLERIRELVSPITHLANLMIIAAVIVFVYIADWAQNLVRIYEAKEKAAEKILHVLIDTINGIYGLSFVFFAVPILYYLAVYLTTPGV